MSAVGVGDGDPAAITLVRVTGLFVPADVEQAADEVARPGQAADETGRHPQPIAGADDRRRRGPRHWIGLRWRDAVYDANVGWWTTRTDWSAQVAPLLAADVPRRDGGWYVRAFVAIEGEP